MVQMIKDLPCWFWCFVLAVFVAGNVSGVVILCSIIDIMAGGK
jgi:hypothetical protein